MARYWYAYLGVGDPTLASNYSYAGVQPGCLNGSMVCAILAPNGGTTPTGPLSPNLRRYISAGLITQIAQPQDEFEIYVVMKTL